MELLNKKVFDSLTRKEKILAICRDVIIRLDSELLKDFHGSLCRNIHVDTEWPSKSKEVQEFINQNECAVCAKGAVMMSWVVNFNNTTLCELQSASHNLVRNDTYPKELVEIFGRAMLDDMELAFECEFYSWHHHKYPAYTSAWDERVAFEQNGEEWTIREIMENIIFNDGELNIFKYKDYRLGEE